jgi:hypothetical protein
MRHLHHARISPRDISIRSAKGTLLSALDNQKPRVDSTSIRFYNASLWESRPDRHELNVSPISCADRQPTPQRSSLRADHRRRDLSFTAHQPQLGNNLDLMTALTSPRFLRPRQFGTRRHVGLWSAPLGASIGDVCARANVAVDVESMSGKSGYGQPKRSTGAGSANGGRTP